jgi:hypothetical protein
MINEKSYLIEKNYIAGEHNHSNNKNELFGIILSKKEEILINSNSPLSEHNTVMDTIVSESLENYEKTDKNDNKIISDIKPRLFSIKKLKIKRCEIKERIRISSSDSLDRIISKIQEWTNLPRLGLSRLKAALRMKGINSGKILKFYKNENDNRAHFIIDLFHSFCPDIQLVTECLNKIL